MNLLSFVSFSKWLWWMMLCQLGEMETTYPRISSLYVCKLESVKTRICTRYGRQEWTRSLSSMKVAIIRRGDGHVQNRPAGLITPVCSSSSPSCHLPALPSSRRLVPSTCWGPTKGTGAESNISPVFPRLDIVSDGPVVCWLIFSPSHSLSDLRFASPFPAV